MAVRTVFASESGNQPASQLDNMFSDVWNGAPIRCTATGTNSIVLTPAANYGLPTAYVSGQFYSFVAAATSTGSVTVQVGSLAALNLYDPSLVQTGSGEIVINQIYLIRYDGSLNSGNGGFVIINSTAVSVAQPVQAGFKNLVITNTTAATAASQVVVTADQVVVWNASNGGFTIVSFAPPTLNINSSGANGLDTGSFTGSTWYSIWAIYNPTTATAAGLFSTSATAPTLPSGYTYKARLGWIRANATPAFVNMMQKGRRAQYLVGTYNSNALAICPQISNGAAGTFSVSSPTLVTTSMVNLVPTTASEAFILVSNSWETATGVNMLLAPNTNYGGTNNGPEGSNGMIYNNWLNSAANYTFTSTMELEATTIAWASSGAGGALQCQGWVDNL